MIKFIYARVKEHQDEMVSLNAGCQLTTDDGVRLLAKAFTSYAWTQGMDFNGMGDLVAKRLVQVNLQNVAQLTEIDEFRRRVEVVIAAGADSDLQVFLEAWQRAEQDHDN